MSCSQHARNIIRSISGKRKTNYTCINVWLGAEIMSVAGNNNNDSIRMQSALEMEHVQAL